MKYPVFYAVLLTFFLASLSAMATPLEDKVSALKKAIKDEIAADQAKTPSNPPPPPYGNATYLLANLDQLMTQSDNGNANGQLDMQLNQVLSSFSTEAVQKAGRELIAEIRQERKDRADAATAELQAALKHVQEVITKAQKPEDLDGLLVDLQKYQNQNRGYNQDNQALYQQLSAAFDFTKTWQNYLSHLTSGQSQMANNDLQMLGQNNYSVGIIPRSQILALSSGLAKTKTTDALGAAVAPISAADILKNVKTLDDMEPALKKLDELRQTTPYGGVNQQVYNDAQQTYNALGALVRTYNDIKAGLPTNFNIFVNQIGYNGYNGNPSLISSDLSARMQVFAIAHYLDKYKGTPPAADEKPMDFLARVITDAQNRQDWALLKKAVDLQDLFTRNIANGAYNGNSNGFDSLLIGINQEAAGQYAMAVVSYQGALKSSSTYIPAKWIGDKLASIQKDHSQEYDQGMQMVSSQTVPRYYQGAQGFLGIPYGSNPMIVIPGATTNAPPVAPAPTTKVESNVPASTNAAPVK